MTGKPVSNLSQSDEWATPPELFGALSALYGPFNLDAAASPGNSRCAVLFTKELDALARDWPWPRIWLNPPYSRGNVESFLAHARHQVQYGPAGLVCALVPGHTAEGWWHRHVEAPAGAQLGTGYELSLLGPRTQVRWEALTVETLRIRGRVRFVEASGATGSARFPSVAVVLAKPGVLPALGAPPVLKRGPKSSLSAADAESVRRLLAAGHSVSRACQLAGVHRRAWYRHGRTT